MKTIKLSLVLVLISFAGFSQTGYEKAMKDGLDSLKNIKSLNDFQTVANYFERIANAEPKEWLPGYYAAYCYIILSFKEQDAAKKTNLVTKSENLVNQLLKINPDESEIYALQGMLYQAYIQIDPQNNAPVYAAKASSSFDKSIELNSDNPRPYSLKGMNLMYTPEAYGGGMKAACPLLQKAAELFNKFETKGEFMPDWGKDYNAQLCGKCGEKVVSSEK